MEKKVMIGAYVPEAVAERFKALSRISDGGVSAALLRMIGQEVGDKRAVAPRGVGQGELISVRLKNEERVALALAAHQRGTTPANWMRSLALVHLQKRPEWNHEELELFRDVGRELRRIGVNINQIAAGVNAAALIGECPPGQGEAAERATELVRYEIRRLAAVVTGNFDYWGLPTDERPTAARGALAREAARDARAKSKRDGRLRTRKFAQQKGEDEAD